MPTTPVTPYVPQYITVHLGAPSAAAENVTVSFPEYVKNVASSEIYPTWPENAIRANIYAQIIDDVAGNTLVAASSLDKAIEGNGSNKAAARAVGKLIAERAKAKGIDTVVFDRGGYLYHGRVAELAEGAREGGLEF